MATTETPVPETRPQRKTAVGIVTSAKAQKTIAIRLDRLVKHPVVGKYVKRQSVIYAHDEAREAREGDQVEVMETRPLSKTKCWRLVKVLRSRPT